LTGFGTWVFQGERLTWEIDRCLIIFEVLVPHPRFRDISFFALVKRLVRLFVDHTIPDRAAQLAYYFVFALFPMLACMVTLAGYLPIENVVSNLIERASYMMPESTVATLQDQLNALTQKTHPRILTFGFLVAWWSASRGVNALRAALNLAYGVKESRPFWKTQGLALLITVSGAVLLILGFSAIALGGKAAYWLAHKLNVGSEYLKFWFWLRWPITAALLMLSLALTYYLLPDVKQRFRFITLGSVVSTLGWLAATWGFTQFVGHFGHYNVTYGAIGGVIILLTWFYISGLLFITGGEINAILEQALRSPARGPEPATLRPSVAPPGAVKSASSAQPSNRKASHQA
jgi:membrane protein